MHILMADDHLVVRAGMRHLLQQLADDVIITEANNYEQLLAAAQKGVQYDLALIDLLMPGAVPAEGLKSVLALLPATPIIVISAIENHEEAEKAIKAGAMGYIPKSADADEILGAIRQVLAGNIIFPGRLRQQKLDFPDAALATDTDDGWVHELTRRQRDVVKLLAQGKSNQEIARELGMSENTAKIHISAILRTMGVPNRTKAAIMAAEFFARAALG